MVLVQCPAGDRARLRPVRDSLLSTTSDPKDAVGDGPNRRRHRRAPAPLVVTLVIDGAPVPVARLIDASLGGAFIELSGLIPPLHARGTARVERAGDVVERGARVVRVRWGGRERGAVIAPAIALLFEDDDADAAVRLEEMLRSLP